MLKLYAPLAVESGHNKNNKCRIPADTKSRTHTKKQTWSTHRHDPLAQSRLRAAHPPAALPRPSPMTCVPAAILTHR